jgi:hypothetical protein
MKHNHRPVKPLKPRPIAEHVKLNQVEMLVRHLKTTTDHVYLELYPWNNTCTSETLAIPMDPKHSSAIPSIDFTNKFLAQEGGPKKHYCYTIGHEILLAEQILTKSGGDG